MFLCHDVLTNKTKFTQTTLSGGPNIFLVYELRRFMNANSEVRSKCPGFFLPSIHAEWKRFLGR